MTKLDAGPTWSTWREIPQVCRHPPYLTRCLKVAFVVGTILFVINQLDVVVSGRATTIVWAKVVLTYVVPFSVSNYGLLVGRRREKSPG